MRPYRYRMDLKEGFDFYFDKDGLMVLTELYLKNRGYCCQNRCRHCPYGFNENPQPDPTKQTKTCEPGE